MFLEDYGVFCFIEMVYMRIFDESVLEFCNVVYYVYDVVVCEVDGVVIE